MISNHQLYLQKRDQRSLSWIADCIFIDYSLNNQILCNIE